MSDHDREDTSTAVRTRGPELAVAGFLLAIATLVITDSLRVGIGWADDGPRAGYFPFYIGLLLLASSASRRATSSRSGSRPMAAAFQRLALTTVRSPFFSINMSAAPVSCVTL